MDSRRRRRSPALRGYQAATLQALARGIARYPAATFTVLYPRQAGKNEVAAALVACLLRGAAAEGGSVVVCAPSFDPQARISLERVRRTLDDTRHLFHPAGRGRVSGNRVTVGRAEAVFLSAQPGANVAGHTASLALVVDEAQDIDADWFDRQFRPMAASTAAATVLFGTPWDGETLLDRALAANRARDAAQPGRRYRDWLPFHHEVSWEQVARSVPAYARHVAAERARLGEGHPAFVTQYLLQTTRLAGRLFSAAQLARLRGNHARQRIPRAGERYVAGLDLAGPGGDASVLTIARVAGERVEVVDHNTWQGAPYAALVAGVASAVGRWGIERLCVDATGLGGPLAAELERQCGRVVAPFLFPAASKSELGYALLAAAETGRLALYGNDGSPEWRASQQQLRDCAARFEGGQLRWEAVTGHDDCVASLALCLHAAQALGPARVARGRAKA